MSTEGHQTIPNILSLKVVLTIVRKYGVPSEHMREVAIDQGTEEGKTTAKERGCCGEVHQMKSLSGPSTNARQ